MAKTGRRERGREQSARARLIAAAARLFQERGYAGVGLSEILAAAGAPKGSLYHHFPEGKAQLAAAALEAAGASLEASLHHARAVGGDAAGMIEGYGDLLAGWLEGSGFTRGCPIATVALEQSGEDGVLSDVVRTVFARWRAALSGAIAEQGVSAGRAERLADLALASVEGALILARAERNAEPVRVIAGEIARMVRVEARA